MVYGNTAVILMVIAVVSCVLCLVAFGMFRLSRSIDRSES